MSMTKGLYYYRQSWGIGTNLQLHALRVAWRLLNDLKSKQDPLREGRIKERCVVIVDLLGLSLSQLLGQNYGGDATDLDAPRKLFESFLAKAGANASVRVPPNLKVRFDKFWGFYDDCRHFGASKHGEVDQLTLESTDAFMDPAIEIWDLVCLIEGDGLEFASVRLILPANEDEEDIDEW